MLELIICFELQPENFQNERHPLPIELLPALHDGAKVVIQMPQNQPKIQKKKKRPNKFLRINQHREGKLPIQIATGFLETQSQFPREIENQSFSAP